MCSISFTINCSISFTINCGHLSRNLMVEGRARLNLSGNKIGADGTGSIAGAPVSSGMRSEIRQHLQECWCSAQRWFVTLLFLMSLKKRDKGAQGHTWASRDLCVGQWMYKRRFCSNSRLVVQLFSTLHSLLAFI